MNKIKLCLLLSACCLLNSCRQAPPEPPPLAGAKIGGPFQLTNQDGVRVSEQSFAGRYRLIYFGFTFCPDICPTDLARLMQGYRRFEQQDPALAAKLQPIFISLDPARDNPTVLKQFTGNFHPNLTGLTGSPTEIEAVAKGYGVYYKVNKSANNDAYLIDHSRLTYLFSPDGKPLALIPQDGTAEQIAAELKRWIR
jgi:protein SCO1